MEEFRRITESPYFINYQKQKAQNIVANYLNIRGITSTVQYYLPSGQLEFALGSRGFKNYRPEQNAKDHSNKEFVKIFERALIEKKVVSSPPLYTKTGVYYQVAIIPVINQQKVLGLLSLSFFLRTDRRNFAFEEKEKAELILSLMFTPRNRNESSNEQEKYNLIYENLNSINAPPRTTHRRILIFSLLNWDYLTPVNQHKIKEIINHPLSSNLKKLSFYLSDPEVRNVKHDLLRCWDPIHQRIDTTELAQRYLKLEHTKRMEMQKILQKETPNTETIIKIRALIREYSDKYNLANQKQEILDLLFLREWVAMKDPKMNFVLKTIKDYPKLPLSDQKYWKDFHLEYLKKG